VQNNGISSAHQSFTSSPPTSLRGDKRPGLSVDPDCHSISAADCSSGVPSSGPGAPTIRKQVLEAQPEFSQRKHVELATALALAQLRQNLVGKRT